MRTAFDLSESATRQVVSAAGRAPSLLNTQPWRFRLGPDRIEVHADPRRRLIAHDPEDRELRIACGAALFNLRLALHAHGVTPVVTIEPGEAPDALAVIRRGPATAQSRDDATLLKTIGQRRTNRQPFLDAAVPASDRRLLIRAAADEHAVLHEMTDHAGRSELRRIVAAADRRQRDDAVCRAELDAWTGFGDTGARTGCRWPRPDRNPNPRTRGHTGTSDTGCPGSECSADRSEPSPSQLCWRPSATGTADQVQAGQALQRVLLTGDRIRAHRLLPLPTHRGHRTTPATAPTPGRPVAPAGDPAPWLHPVRHDLHPAPRCRGPSPRADPGGKTLRPDA